MFFTSGSQLQVDEKASSNFSDCLQLPSVAPRAIPHPIRSVLRFDGLRWLVKSCSYPEVRWKRSVGGCVLAFDR